MSEAPSFLILGGCGFIGRNFVKFLVDKKLAKKIRVADKSLPATSYLSAEHKAAFDSDLVEFSQCDLTRDAHAEKAFKDCDFDFVVNLCGETRFGMEQEEYKVKCVQPVVKVAPVAAAKKVKKWIEMSTAQVYKPNPKKPAEEKDELAPWTGVATYRLEAEKALAKAAKDALPYVIFRPAYVYGPADLNSLTPRIICAAVYQERKETMKFLWGAKLKLNTVHVDDVCVAIYRACTTEKYKSGSIFNLADTGDSDQGKINKALAEIFGIKVDFYGSTVSKMASSVGLSTIVREANDKHVPGWTKLCQKHKINTTPLSPYLDQELLRNNHLHINGLAITKADPEFKYTHPACTEDELRKVVAFFVSQKVFPEVMPKKK